MTTKLRGDELCKRAALRGGLTQPNRELLPRCAPETSPSPCAVSCGQSGNGAPKGHVLLPDHVPGTVLGALYTVSSDIHYDVRNGCSLSIRYRGAQGNFPKSQQLGRRKLPEKTSAHVKSRTHTFTGVLGMTANLADHLSGPQQVCMQLHPTEVQPGAADPQ